VLAIRVIRLSEDFLCVSYGIGTRPPPISPTSEMVRWGARNGPVVTNSVRSPVRPATLATLYQARLSVACLISADFTFADLGEVNLDGANLDKANLDHARIHDVVFCDVDLSTVQGLDTVWHRGPSVIGIDTLYRSHGQIPEVFLRGCGVPDQFITYVRPLVERPFDYHSCFISSSNKDTALAERLYADLQASGVRCWFAPEDMKICDKFLSRFD
jgi:hypothetical protein